MEIMQVMHGASAIQRIWQNAFLVLRFSHVIKGGSFSVSPSFFDA